MKVSMVATMNYVADVPWTWPQSPALYDRARGRQSFHDGLAQVELADAVGFDYVSLFEHHYSNVTVSPHPGLSAAWLAGRLKRASLAIWGYIMPLNNPVRVAEEIATLDNLTDGRLVFGLVRGIPNEYQTYGVNPAETRGITDEGAELVLRALTEPEPFGWEGRHFRYRTVSVWPRPLTQPHPRAYMLGNSPETAAFAARHRIGVGFALGDWNAFRGNYELYRRNCTEAGWEPTPDHVVYRGNCFVARTDEEALRLGGKYWGSVIATVASGSEGFSKEQQAQLAQRPAVNFIGSPETVVRQIKECRDACGAGIVDLFVQHWTMPQEVVMECIELLGKEVLPQVRSL